MKDRNLQELQARIEVLEARLAQADGRPTARLGWFLSGIRLSRRARFALATAVLVVATASYAATVSMPYTFINGTIADADEVNANFSALATESNAQDSRLAALEAQVTTNTGNIATNTGQLATNTPAITINTGNIATNTGQLATNTPAITVNTGNIATNTGQLATNTPAIATNAGNITTNTNQLAINTPDITALETTFAGVNRNGTLLTFSGMNVQVVDGSGNTAGAVNGLGNLIVGYNENAYAATRTGSHNLVVGYDHEYTSYSGFVAGYRNQITGPNASVSGGWRNAASYLYSSVSGGGTNTASAHSSSVSGGYTNTASGNYSSVSGGYYGQTTTYGASISGGYYNTASGSQSTVSGGSNNSADSTYSVTRGCATQVGDEVTFEGCNVNIQSGSGLTIGAVNGLGNLIVGYNENSSSATRTGSHNLVLGYDHEYTSYGGMVAGRLNTISNATATVTGGYSNTASGHRSSVTGGYNNTAAGDYTAICGGSGANRTASYQSAIGPVPSLTITGP